MIVSQKWSRIIKNNYKSGFLKILVLYIILFTAFSATAKTNSYVRKVSPEFVQINNLILVDAKKAKNLIDSLNLVFNKSGDKNRQAELSLITIEYYRSIGDFPHMKHQLFMAMNHIDRDTPLRIKLGVDFYSAIIDGREGDDKKMLSSLKRIYFQAKKNDNLFLQAQCLAAFGKYYLNNNEFSKGQYYLKKAGEMYFELGEFHSNAAVKMTSGIGYFWEGNNDKAFEMFHQGLAYSKKHDLHKSYCQSLTNLAEAHLFVGNMDSSKLYYDEFLRKKNQSDIRDLYQVYWGLEYYYKELNRIDSAYHYATLKTEIDDSIRGIMEKELGNDIELKYNDDLNKKIIEQKDKEFKNQQKVNLVQLIIFLIIGIVLIMLLIFVINSNRKKNRMNKLLQEQKASIALKNEIIDISLKEKEVLLKEIHHRVKNNLQIISSLLNLQSKNITDKHALDILEEGKERIQAIALIHHRLYRSDNFSYISMEEYLPDLIAQLKKAYVSSTFKLDTTIQTDNIKMSLDTAVPLGLIICELITNSFKHAFTERKDGEILISLQAGDQPKSFVLLVKDNGVGFKYGMNFLVEGSLGSEIISALTEQLNGILNIDTSEKGTTFTLNFIDSQMIV